MGPGLVRRSLLVVCVAAQPAISASYVPQGDALPGLVLDDLSPSVRAGILRTYNEARAQPRDAAAVERLAMLLHAYEQYSAADACYRLARRLVPRSLSAAYLSGLVQAELGDLTAAVSSFREALAMNPGYLPARLRLAETLMNAGELAASRGEYEALARDFPELAVAHYGLGRLSSAIGNAKAAAEEYERAVSVAPQFGPAHYALALAYRDLGANDRARPHLDAYAKLGTRRPTVADPLFDQVIALRSTARELIVEGGRLERAGEITQAIARHLQALEADPAAAQAHVNLIALYGRSGALEKAEEHYRAALALGSSLAEAHYNYGVLMAGLNRLVDATDAFEKTLAVDPFHAPAHNNLAALLLQQGRAAEAAAHYRAALANDPQHRIARFNLGRALVMIGRPQDAIDQLRRLLTHEDADTPRFTYALATAYFAAGDIVQAREYAQQALTSARQLGQTDLAARIEAELKKMTTGRH
jgi:tetratricopeptide (TPR) repeat protein